MPAIRNALVIGGGIGGLTAAVALRQAGIEVDLIEKNPNFSVYGVGIIQPNNTLRALDKIGLARRCLQHGTAFPGWRVHDSHGKFIMDAPSESRAAPDYPPNNGIPRPALQSILSDAAIDHGATVRLGTTVERIDDHGDYVEVAATDGRIDQYDLVIGCDGLYSETRERVFGSTIKPEFTGQAVWRYNMPRPESLVWGEIHNGPRTKVGLTPMLPDLMYMFIVSAEPGNPWMPTDQLAGLMRERLHGFTGMVAELAQLIVDPAGVVYKPMENLLLPDPWYKGRVVIIGDAAHATTPHLAQGAAMAVEDAVLLGELLAAERTIEDLLAEFMRRRFDRARFVVETSDQIARWEMEEWNGVHNPQAAPGKLLFEATVRLLEDY